MDELQLDLNKMSEEELNSYKVALDFARAQIQRLRNPNIMETSLETVSFAPINREGLLTYLKSPKLNEKNIRNVSIAMFNASMHYRRLIQYYALMPLWSYIIKPLAFDKEKTGDPETGDKKSVAYKKAFQKAAGQIEAMNLKHEMQKVLTIGLREGVFYGAIWQNSIGGSFSIQKINPDICKITSIEDGTWLYSVDMSRIKESELYRYPPEFTEMYAQYKLTREKWQEVPSKICFCFKADETLVEYSMPPWAATIPSLLDIENYKALQDTANEIANYKLIHMKVPVNSSDAPKFSFELAQKYYEFLCANLPPYVGASFSPMELTDIDFDKDGNLRETDLVSRAERTFWQSSGTSPLLFGDAANTTAGALKLSIKADEELVFGWMNQCERIVNRLLKNIAGTQKFQITFLPVTVFNQGEMVDYFKNASTLGIPVKSAYAAVLNVRGLEIPGVDYIEREFLDMDELVPLSSSYNTAVEGEAGRPAADDGDLTESGIRTRENDNE